MVWEEAWGGKKQGAQLCRGLSWAVRDEGRIWILKVAGLDPSLWPESEGLSPAATVKGEWGLTGVRGVPRTRVGAGQPKSDSKVGNGHMRCMLSSIYFCAHLIFSIKIVKNIPRCQNICAGGLEEVGHVGSLTQAMTQQLPAP